MHDYNEAIRLDSANAKSYQNRGLVWFAKGRFDNAIKDFSEAIKLDQEFANAYYNRGCAWQAAGELGNAIKNYTESIRLSSKFAPVYSNYAWALATSSDSKFRDGAKAVELATRACELSVWKQWQCIGTLAAAHAESGDWEAAIMRQLQAIEMATAESDKRGKSVV